ncbi:MAG: hypothetical protein DMF67_13035 [Acidobacteria bacterium]|nr:MAG: hypothetical protein DMF67_13035 [Acidobacteriota bacterium]
MLAKIALSLLTLTTLINAQGQSSRANAPQPSSEIPTVSLCALLSKPADYDGKEIRVRAQYNVGFEWSYFDSSCKEYAIETTPYWTANVVWAEFGESVKTATEPEIYEKFKQARGLCCPDGWRTQQTELLVTGKFFKARSIGYEYGFGHEGRYAFKIVVDKVEEVGATKTVSP